MSELTLKKEDNLKTLIQSPQFRDQVAKALPKHITADRMLRVILTAINKNPKLLSCTKESLLGALMTCSQFGLEPDGRLAHLIPYYSKKTNTTYCQLIIDYKGKVELLMRTGLVANIHADVVRDNDEFEFDRGLVTKHKINFKEPRGKVYAAYIICRFKDGTEKHEVMDLEELEDIHKRSKTPDSGPWVTDRNEMYKKTVFHRGSKWLPMSPEIRDLIQKDIENEFETSISVPATVSPSFEAPSLNEVTEDAVELPKEGSGEIPPSEMSIEIIRSKMKQAKIQESLLVDYLLEKEWLPKGDPKLDALTDANAFMIVNSIEKILGGLK